MQDANGNTWFFHSIGECDRCHLPRKRLYCFFTDDDEDGTGLLLCEGCVKEEGAKLKREGGC